MMGIAVKSVIEASSFDESLKSVAVRVLVLKYDFGCMQTDF